MVVVVRSRARMLVGALAGLLLAGGLTQLAASPAAAVPPANLQPSGGTTLTGIPPLTWDRTSATDKYDVQVSVSPTFASTLDTVTGTVNDTYVPKAQLPSGPLYWRVRVNGSGGAWTDADFVRADVAAPTLTGPADGAVLGEPSSPPVLTWLPVPGADGYQLQYGTDPNFVDQTTTSSTENTSFVVGLQLPTTYYWRVRAQLSTGFYTAWANAYSYGESGLSGPAGDPQAPANDVNQSIQDVILDWDPIPGAAEYDLQISSDINFASGVTTRNAIFGTRYSPPAGLDNDQYYWRVRPVDAAGNKLAFASVPTWTFLRTWPDQPVLEYPADASTVGDPFYFQWTPATLASSYEVQVSPNPDFQPVSSTKSCTTVHTTLSMGVVGSCFPAALGHYYWRVIASDEAIDTAATGAQVHEFTYDPGHVVMTAPANAATVTVPTMRWQPRAGAAKYRLTITGGSFSRIVTTSATSWTADDLDLDVTYQWDVRTVDQRGNIGSGLVPTSQPSFTLVAPGTAPTDSAPQPTPANVGSSYRLPNLAWTPAVGADYYKVWVKRSTAGAYTSLGVDYHFPAATDVSSSWLSPGSYDFFVEAYDAQDHPISAGGLGQFTILALPPVTVYRAGLTGNSTTGNLGTPVDTCDLSLPSACQNLRQTPVLDWDVPDADIGYYHVYLSRDAQLTNLVTQSDVASSQWTDVDALPDSQAGSAYFWLVLPCTADGHCAQVVNATRAFNKLGRPLTLISPANGASVQDDVTLTWDDYLVSEAQVSGVDPDPGTPLDVPARTEARDYRVQVSQDPTFTTGVSTDVVDQRSFTAYDETYAEGTYYWRVQAIDGSANSLGWSPTRSFVKSSPVPTLASPAADATVSGDSALSWNAVDFAKSYYVEVYKNDDAAANPANRVVNATTNRIGYVLDSLDATAGPYRWRVRRRDADNRYGGWSPLRRLYVSAPVPVLQVPGTDALVEPSDALFTWDIVTGATKYKFERRLVGSSTVTETVTTPATAWASTAAITGGSWEWRVTALDTSGHALGSAAYRPFSVVDTPLATIPVGVSGSGKVGTPLTLSPPTWNMPAGTVTTTYQWYRGTSALSGQTGVTYDVVTADVGKSLTVRATGTRPGYKTGTSTSNAIVGVIGDTISPTAPPTINGVPAARETLTASPGTWPGSPKYAYQWFVAGAAVAKATSSTYVVRTRDAGLPILVRVIATTSGYAPGTAYSSPLTVQKLPTSMTAALQSKRIPKRGRGVVLVSVDVEDLGVPLGSVQIKEGTKVLATVILKNDSGGDLTIRLKRLRPGKHKLNVAYLGSTATAASKAKRVKLKVLTK